MLKSKFINVSRFLAVFVLGETILDSAPLFKSKKYKNEIEGTAKKIQIWDLR